MVAGAIFIVIVCAGMIYVISICKERRQQKHKLEPDAESGPTSDSRSSMTGRDDIVVYKGPLSIVDTPPNEDPPPSAVQTEQSGPAEPQASGMTAS